MTDPLTGSEDQVGLVAAVWRYRWLTLAFVLVAGGLAAFVTISGSDSAEAKATVALTDPRGNSIFRQGSTANVDLTRYTAERAAFAESDAVLNRASELLEGEFTSAEIDDAVVVTPRPDTSILAIKATAADPAEAIAIADAVAGAYQELAADETSQKAELAIAGLSAQREEALAIIRNPSSTSAEVSAGTQILSTVNSRAAEIESAAELFGNGVAFADPASEVEKGGMVELLRNSVAGALIGLVLGAALAWVLADRARGRVAVSGDDLEEEEEEPPASTPPSSAREPRRPRNHNAAANGQRAKNPSGSAKRSKRPASTRAERRG